MGVPTELEYKQKIEDAFNKGDYSGVILLENDMMEQAYATMAGDIPKEKIFEFFQEHDFAPVLIQKGLAALHLGDPSLSGQSFEEAIKSIPNDSDFATPFFYS